MKKTVMVLATTALVFSAGEAMAGGSATANVNYQVQAVNEITATDATPALVINSATAGGGYTDATATGTYSITTNGSNKKISAALTANMPTGLTLQALATAAGGGAATTQTLTQTAVDLVTGIGPNSTPNLNITFTLHDDGTAVLEGSQQTAVLTLTIADGV